MGTGKNLRKKIRRVDVQVSVLIIITTIFCTSVVFYIGYSLTYKDMILNLEDRVTAIHDYLEDSLDKSTFLDINTREDMDKLSYISMKKVLEDVKMSSDVRYLYTAKKDSNGNFVYVIDGLDYKAKDFRYPGDMIEHEIYGDMERALNGEIILPDEIKKTDWGDIFITYFPIHDNHEVVGVLGIEFEASHQYDTFRKMKLFLPFIIFITCIAGTAAAVLVFRRVSNPAYQDMANTDHLTELKNRNAFETDLNNMDARTKKEGIGIVIADLNSLKLVNDRLGHSTGDIFILTAARAIRSAVTNNSTAYRLGGDEFVILFWDTDAGEIKEFIENVNCRLVEFSAELARDIPLSLSIGYELFHPEKDKNLKDLFKRADAAMYRQKREFHDTEA